MRIDIENVKFEDTAMGKSISELQKLRDELNQYRADQAAYQAAAEHREKKAKIKGFVFGFFSSLISTVIGGLVVYYWPVIVSLF